MKVVKRVSIIVVILVIIAGIAYISIARANSAKVQTVSLTRARKTTLAQTVSVTGNIEANDEDQITLNTSQKVAKILVQEGQKVTKGQTLVKLDTTDLQYQLQKAQLNQQLNNITSTTDKTSAENQISQAQINLQIAQKSLSDAQQAVAEAKQTMDADKQLLDGGYISNDDYQKDVDAYNNAVTQEKNAENQVQLKEIDLNNAKANLQNINENNAQQNDKTKIQSSISQSDIANYQNQIAESDIKSNISGTVEQINVKENEYPQQGSNTILIYDLSRYKLVADVAQYDAINVKVGQKATITVKGISKPFTGTVTKVYSIADNATSSGSSSSSSSSTANTDVKVQVEITLDNPDNNIKVGYVADANIITKEKPNVVAVSFDAIKTDLNGQKYVFTVQNGKVKKKYIQTGMETDFDVEVTSGLNAGDEYIPNPSDTLKENDTVKVMQRGFGGGVNSGNISSGKSSSRTLFRVAGGGRGAN